MGAEILTLPEPFAGLSRARITLMTEASSREAFEEARRHLFFHGSASDKSLARRETRARSMRQARESAERYPMPAIPAASPGGDKAAPSGGNLSLPAMAPDCSAHGATASAEEELSAAEALSIHAERWVTRLLVTIIAVCLAFLLGVHLGGAIATAAIPTL